MTMTPEEKMDNVLAKQMAICSIIEQSGWIPVTERMPDNGVEVLTWNPTGPYQTVACWVGNEWSSGDCRADAYDRFEEEGITHWMPLPAPPADGK